MNDPRLLPPAPGDPAWRQAAAQIDAAYGAAHALAVELLADRAPTRDEARAGVPCPAPRREEEAHAHPPAA